MGHPENLEAATSANQGYRMLFKGLELLSDMNLRLDQLVRLYQSNSRNNIGDGAVAALKTVTTTPHGVARSNPERRGSQYINTSSAAFITLGLGIGQVAPGVGLVLAPGAVGVWDGRISSLVWTGSVSAVSDGNGTGLLVVIEA